MHELPAKQQPLLEPRVEDCSLIQAPFVLTCTFIWSSPRLPCLLVQSSYYCPTAPAECKLMMSAAGRLAAAAATAAASYASPATRQLPAIILCWWSAVCSCTAAWRSCHDEQPSASWHASNGNRLWPQSWHSLPSDAGRARICPWNEWLQVRPCPCGFAVKYASWLTIMYALAIHTDPAAVHGKMSCWMSCMFGSAGRQILTKFELAVVALA